MTVKTKKTIRPTITPDNFKMITEIGNFLNLDSNAFKDFNAIIAKVFSEHLKIDGKLNSKINEVCKNNITRDDLLIPVIDKYINKTLKGYGVIKEKHKKSVSAESELLKALKEMVVLYDKAKPENKRFISATMVQKFLLMNHEKYKQKHLNVIRRILLSDQVDFIKQYHEKNNLTINSNKRGNTNE